MPGGGAQAPPEETGRAGKLIERAEWELGGPRKESVAGVKAKIEAAKAKRAARESGAPLPSQPTHPRRPRLDPDNELALEVFLAMLSQLNVGFGGVVGFRYEALSAVFDNVVYVPPEERREVTEKLRVLEAWLIQRYAPEKKERQ